MPIFDKDENGITRICPTCSAASASSAGTFDGGRETNPGHGPPQRFRHVGRLRVADRGLPRKPGSRSTRSASSRTCTRATRAQEKTMSVLERFARYKLPIRFTRRARVRPDHAAGDRRPQRLPGRRVANDARGRSATGRRSGHALPDAVRTPAVEAMTWWGFTTGAGSTPGPASSAWTTRASPRTTRCAG